MLGSTPALAGGFLNLSQQQYEAVATDNLTNFQLPIFDRILAKD